MKIPEMILILILMRGCIEVMEKAEGPAYLGVIVEEIPVTTQPSDGAN